MANHTKYFFILLFLSFPSPALAQPDPFPYGTDDKIEREVRQSLSGMDESVGRLIGQRYSQIPGIAFPPHEWKCGNQRTEPIWKRDSIISLGTPLNFEDKFMGCFEPIAVPSAAMPPLIVPLGNGLELVVDPPPLVGTATWPAVKCCPTERDLLLKCGVTKDNRGYSLTYWWPENNAEAHNYGISAFDPTWECQNAEFRRTQLTAFLRAFRARFNLNTPIGRLQMEKSASEAGIPPELREEPHIGQTHWAGLLPGDQTYHAEAHVYRTYLDVLTAMNKKKMTLRQSFLLFFTRGSLDGYRVNCNCFYNVLNDPPPESKIVNGWTEQPKFLPFWRTPELSKLLDPDRYRAIENFRAFTREGLENDMCASYRLSKWPALYADLKPALDINPNGGADLSRICFKGGAELFPITGQLIGHFSPLPSAAYIARRSLFLFGREWLVPANRRIHKYSDRDDKLQRIFPAKQGIPGRCFRSQEIPNYLEEGPPDWPRDLMRDQGTEDIGPFPGGKMDDIRYQHWNKRKACMCPYIGPMVGVRWNGKFISCAAVETACRTIDRGDYEDSGSLEGENGHNPLTKVVPPGIPVPFMEEISQNAWNYTLDNGQKCNLKQMNPNKPKRCEGQSGMCE